MREKHTCLNGVDWLPAAHGGTGVNGGMNGNMGAMGGHNMGQHPHQGNGMNAITGMGTVEIRQDEDGNIVGGARVLGPVESRPREVHQGIIPVLPKVQRNSASRLPFLMEILPKLMIITKETTPVEIRECLLREYGAEVHLQQCRRAKTEILKKQVAGVEGGGEMQQQQQQQQQNQQQQNQNQDMRTQPSMEGMGNDGSNDGNQQLFTDMNATPHQSPHPFTLHASAGVVTPVMPERSAAALRSVGEAPVRCPFCINHRWMRSIKDAVEHMSMHVVVS